MQILVAEDEPAIREAEVAYLEHAGYQVLQAGNGEAALAMFRSRKPDMAIIDVNMPVLDGIAVCRDIRRTSTIPIIMVTAKDGDDDELQGLEAGADDYIKKPFNPNILIARVQSLMRRHGSGRLAAGDLVLDPDAMLATKYGQPLSLTSTQFNVLHALMSRPGVVYTRAQLIDAVYADPAGHAIYDRTIDAHIKSIRKQIEDDPSRPHYVETVIGSGYKFRGNTS